MNYIDIPTQQIPYSYNDETRYIEVIPEEYKQQVETPYMKIISGDTVKTHEILWLWKPYIPFGKVTLVAGDPGTGKSTFVLDLLAKVTKGECMPFEDGEEKRMPMNVLYQCAEDNLSDTIMPRFNAAGGDPKYIKFVDESKQSLTFDDERLEHAVAQTGARVVVLDPLSSYIGGETNMNAANEVRSKMNHLIHMAEMYGIAVIVVCHLNKSTQTKAMYKASGSVDVVGGVRSALLVTKGENDNPEERIVTHMKSNLAKEGEAIVFEFRNDGGIVYTEQRELTADDVVNEACARRGRPNVKLERAKEIILESMRDGFVAANEVLEKLEKEEISKSTIQRAKKELGIAYQRCGVIGYWCIGE